MDHQDQTTHDRATVDYELYPLITGAERLAIAQEARGIFKGREEEMLKELADIRRGFNRSQRQADIDIEQDRKEFLRPS